MRPSPCVAPLPTRGRTDALAASALIAVAVNSDARVTKIIITSTSTLFNGQTSGSVGAYEQIKGTAAGEIGRAPNASE